MHQAQEFHPRSRRGPRSALVSFAFLFFLLISAARAHAITYFVDRGNPACSDAGSGSLLTPFCTMRAGVARAGPGVIVYVKPGVYRERLVIPASGAAGNPFVIRALDSNGPVIVDGADDYSTLDKWRLHAADVWLAPAVTVAPKQVFVDGRRLTPSTASPEQIPASSFRHVAGTGLYVNVGGGSPGARQTLVGARTNAFRITGRSWVEIQNFQVTRCDDKGIYVLSGSSFVKVAFNRVSLCGSNGISVVGSTDVTIDRNSVWENGDHGISLLTGVTRARITGNESHRNARPTVRAATGIYLFASPDNRIEGNRVHHNQDSGIEFADTSNRNVSLQNLSWSNGDHGFDHVRSTGAVHVGDVAWGNHKDGFSIEGTSTGTSLHDCIAVRNGVTTNQYDLYVDPPSMPGFVSDYNVFWSPSTRIRVNGVTYSSIADYASVTRLDRKSIGADPLFEDPASGRFALRAGSPAIDSGISSVAHWPALDAQGRGRIDVPDVTNRGAGPVTYADRGALEYAPPVVPPTLVAPAGVTVAEAATLTFQVQASSVTGQPITHLGADLTRLPAGNDATFTVSSDRTKGTLTWHPTHSDSGVYSVTFIASAFATSSVTTTIRVTNKDRAPAVTTPVEVSAVVGQPVRFDVLASDPDGDAIAALVANLSRLPSGHGATFTTNDSLTRGAFSWTPPPSASGKRYQLEFTARNALSTTAKTSLRVRSSGVESVVAEALPREFDWRGPVPHPARGVASFSVAMPAGGRLDWTIVDLQGRLVWSEASELEAGFHTLSWSGITAGAARAAPGVYFARLRSPFERSPRTLRFLYLR